MDTNHNPIDISMMVQGPMDEESKSMNSSQGISNTNVTGGPSTVPDTHADNHAIQEIDTLTTLWLEKETRFQRNIKRITFLALITNLAMIILLCSPQEIFFSFSAKERTSSSSAAYATMLSSIDSLACFTIISLLFVAYLEKDWENNTRIQIFTFSFLIVNLIDCTVFLLIALNGFTSILTLLKYVARGVIFLLNFQIVYYGYKLQKLYSLEELSANGQFYQGF
jgi:hypothetical protein